MQFTMGKGSSWRDHRQGTSGKTCCSLLGNALGDMCVYGSLRAIEKGKNPYWSC